MAAAAESLPANVRKEIEAAFASLDPKLKHLCATLRDLKGASDSLQTTGVTYSETATHIQGMANQLDTTLKTFTILAPQGIAPLQPAK